jgi:transcriptional regulator with XRE-family HTH domain
MPFQGDLIRRIREAKGWTQSELAERSGVACGRISKYEAGKETARSENLERLIESLDVTSDLILGLEAIEPTAGLERVVSEQALRALGRRQKRGPRKLGRLRRVLDHPHAPRTAEGWRHLVEMFALFQGRPLPTRESARIIRLGSRHFGRRGANRKHLADVP